MNRLNRLTERVTESYQKAVDYYDGLGPRAKLLLWIWVALHIVGGAVFWWIGWEAIFAWLAQLADNIRDLSYGWAILSLIVVVTSVPPLIGYGTAQTLIGFAYGVYPGFFISAGSCLIGGVFSFVVVRRLVHLFAPFIKKDQTFRALSTAVQVKGLPLIILLRLCPFPYPYSNAFFASVESVTLSQFLLATLTITPKLLLHVFIGHRTYLFADPSSRHKMDPLSRYINLGFMVFGTILGSATSWYLYKLTMRYVEEAAGEIGEVDLDLEEGLLGEVDEMLDRDEGRRGSVRLEDGGGGENAGWEGDGDFSDFDEEEEDGIEERGKKLKAREEEELVDLSSRRTSQEEPVRDVSKGTDTRRDSVAWGLDLSDNDDEEEDEISLMDRSGLEAGLSNLRNDSTVPAPKKRID
ncbi:hypothetical protein JCM5353_006844 [Sporobolomyces roseus]